MQIYALNASGERIFIECAEKSRDYFCMECSEVVRSRGGAHMQPHFYHLFPKGACRLQGKTSEHILFQNIIQKSCGGEQEVHFKAIGRIADVAVSSQNIIFEVQCSPITADEVRARISDYASLGWHVIWILYDATFNKRKISAAEASLAGYTHYFAGLRNGYGHIYDQCDVVHRGIRYHPIGATKETIDLSTFRKRELLNTSPSYFPLSIQRRVKEWRHITHGDFLHKALFDDSYNGFFAEILQLERKFSGNTSTSFWKKKANEHLILYCIRIITRSLISFFQTLYLSVIEKSCSR